MQTFFPLQVRQNYHRSATEQQKGVSYFQILSKIASYLEVNLLSRTRYVRDKVFYAFMVISHSSVSHVKVIHYFNKFPVYSSKYLAYLYSNRVVSQISLRDGKNSLKNKY